MVLHGVMYVIHHWRDDLVETRRQARLAFLLVLGSAVGVATISLNFGIYHEVTRGMIVGMAALAILFCVVSSREGLLELAPQESPLGELQPPEQDLRVADKLPRQIDSDDAKKLADLMADGFYKQEKLTLKQLAEAIGIPEYRARRLINQTLGYRNFNDYINQLRIAGGIQSFGCYTRRAYFEYFPGCGISHPEFFQSRLPGYYGHYAYGLPAG